MKYVIKTLKYIGYALLTLLALIFIWVFIQTKIHPDEIPSVFGYKPFIVLSGSMETELYKGDLAIVKNINPDTLKVNDIIAFSDEDKFVVTHRIVEITQNEDGEVEFITKGDNNNTKDSGTVKKENVEGLYVKKISGFGNVVLTMQKPITLITVLAIVVLVAIIWITASDNKLTKEERQELERLRSEKQEVKKQPAKKQPVKKQQTKKTQDKKQSVKKQQTKKTTSKKQQDK